MLRQWDMVHAVTHHALRIKICRQQIKPHLKFAKLRSERCLMRWA
ncbi:hypothetical protein [Fervidibacter sacchari]